MKLESPRSSPPMSRAEIEDFKARIRTFVGYRAGVTIGELTTTTAMRHACSELARACREMRFDDTSTEEDVSLSQTAALLDAAGARLRGLTR